MRVGLRAAVALAIVMVVSGTAACDQKAEAETASPAPGPSQSSTGLSGVERTAGGQDPGPLEPMPSAQQKLAMAAQFDPRRPWFSPYLTTAEVTESKGFYIQFLEASPGSRAERQGWAGYARYVALERSRQQEHAQAEAVRLDEKAAREERDRPEAEELCRRYRANPDMSAAEIISIHERLEQLAIPYPSPLSSCATEVRFSYGEAVDRDRVCSAAPC